VLLKVNFVIVKNSEVDPIALALMGAASHTIVVKAQNNNSMDIADSRKKLHIIFDLVY